MGDLVIPRRPPSIGGRTWPPSHWVEHVCAICGKHYLRQQRNDRKSLYCSISCKAAGLSTTGERVTPANFVNHCERLPGADACWLWRGALNRHGYGRAVIDGVVWLAHRYAYLLDTGKSPGDLKVCHRCDTPACIRPQHLFLGTQADNVSDMIRKGRARHATRLSPEQVIAIRADTRAQRRIAADYHIDQSTVSDIKNFRNWRTL